MKRVAYQEVEQHDGGTICGPIPADIDPELWVMRQAEEFPGHSYCITLYEKVKEFAEDEAQFCRVQGTFWILRDSQSTYQIDLGPCNVEGCLGGRCDHV